MVLKSDNSFTDTSTSKISVSGGTGAGGGQAGIIEVFGKNLVDATSLRSSIGSHDALFVNPNNLTLSTSATSTSSSYPNLNVNDLLPYSQICLYNIELSSQWEPRDASTPTTLNLFAGNNIILDDGSGIQVGNNWTVNMTAGTLPSSSKPVSGNDGIYLNGISDIQTQNGDINLYAANEVIVSGGAIRTEGGGNIQVTAEYGNVNSGMNTAGYDYWPTAPYYTPDPNLGGISTAAGGNVTINAGGDVISFPAATVVFNPTASWSDPGSGAFGSELGNVTINAGGSVYGHFVEADGTGTINAGQNIGTALQNVALSLVNRSWNLNAGWDPVTQTVQSGLGDIYLQEVRNPNGVFDNLQTRQTTRSPLKPTPGSHLFDYGPQASVTLTAGNGVYLTGSGLPRPDDAVPMLLPPILIINAGPGGVVLDTPTATDGQKANDVALLDPDIILFPSPDQNLQITTTGGGWLSSGNAAGTDANLLMSDSGLTQWYNTASGGSALQPFGPQDHASVPALLNNDEPVMINLSGSQMVNNVPVLAGMENIVLQTDKATQINIAGDMIGCSFCGENLLASGPASVTSITVGGQISNAGSFTQVTLEDGLPTLPSADTPLASELPPGTSLSSWYLILALAVDPSSPLFNQSYSGYSPSQLANLFGNSSGASGLLNSALKFPGLDVSGLTYNPNTMTLTAIGPLSSALQAALQSPTLTVVQFGPNGLPALDPTTGHIVLDTIYNNYTSQPIPQGASTWIPLADFPQINSLNTESQGAVALSGAGGYIVGGAGQFNVTAGAISLGNSLGILSVGNGNFSGQNYSFLTPYIASGANLNVQVIANSAIPDATGSLVMPASTIASLGGGSVTVNCTGEIPDSPLNDNGVGVSMDLGSQELLSFETQIMNANNLGLGIYSTGGGDVNVTALGTINIDSSRIATFDGGNVTVISETGDVNAGSGGSVVIPVSFFSPAYSGKEYVPANGIVAYTLLNASDIPGAASLPGNITVTTPQGSIYANLGGISQETFGGVLSSSASSTINLFAGTPFNDDWNSKEPPLYIGNIVLGTSGVIGVNVNAKATGKITGLIISQLSANITADQSFAGTVLSGGPVNLSTPNVGPSLIISVGPVNISGGLPITAKVFSASVNGGAGTLATSSSASSASQSAAGQTSTENQQQVASNSNDNNEKKGKKAELVRTVGRVTVILPEAS